MDIKGKWALLSGATGGLGTNLAHNLAARGCNLVLSARRRDALEPLAQQLRERHGVEVLVEPCDLSAPEAASDLHCRLIRRGIAVDVLVNNAGFGMHGDFVSQCVDATAEMLRVNVHSLTVLTRLFGSDMAHRGSGAVLLVGSLTAYPPCPSYAAYASTKAYVVHFGEALHQELADAGVVVTVLSPGIMDTGFLGTAGHRPSALLRATMLTPARVADIGITALLKGKRSVVAGRMNQLAAFSARLLPRGLLLRLMARSLTNAR
ncbi:SDR family NAD(P)-dependent oxidoreductase [Salipiger mangrovisoli]|uniref:SDR family oxidoreductase n=1 Tax=Salipiger mangrovisoli TaxID=2865933 RepID=A0ABR9XAK8_9RHOB|nr:SDR family oxidoreductase [Salipiger mangrovisoli]MBE9640472.1 SDR family oxidoreductase [Salipiger mangrovisoli]